VNVLGLLVLQQVSFVMMSSSCSFRLICYLSDRSEKLTMAKYLFLSSHTCLGPAQLLFEINGNDLMDDSPGITDLSLNTGSHIPVCTTNCVKCLHRWKDYRGQLDCSFHLSWTSSHQAM